VAVTDINESQGQGVVSTIAESGGTARYWNLDGTREEEVEQVFAEVVEAFGPITVTVNNAGIAGAAKGSGEVTTEEWDRVMGVNVKGVMLCTKHSIQYMKQAGGGSVINLSSILGLVGSANLALYSTSKGVVRLLTKADALTYAEERIRVNSVHPGYIRTSMVENYLRSQGDMEEGFKALAEMHPIGHLGEPDDVAYGVLYLASDESKFVTGSELVIDGGYTAR
jgi:NAD(P)-dependent dehydrogenase (short-subunit alcohol dehydrogenase family)